MTPSSRIVYATNWKYAFGEVLLIVVGISVALAIDEWREDLDNKRTEREYIGQLIRDLKSTEDLMASAAELNASTDDAAAQLLAAFEIGEVIEPEEVRQLLRQNYFDNPVPVLGTAQALVATGDLRLIRDSSIRSRVTQYLSHTRDYWLASLYIWESDYYSSVRSLSRIAAAHGVYPTSRRAEGRKHQVPNVEGFLAHPEAYAEFQLTLLMRGQFETYRTQVAADAAELRELLEEYLKSK